MRKAATWVVTVALAAAALSTIAERAYSDVGLVSVSVPGASRVADATTTSTTTTSTTTTSTTTTSTVPAPVPVADGLTSPVLAPLAAASTYRYGTEERQLLDVYVPEVPTTGGAAPVLVYFHAGGWVAGARTDLPDIVAAQLARGWAVVSVDYAIAPEHRFPEPVRDADLAVRWVRRHGPALGLRSDVIVAVGASAGGHVAAWLAANADAHRAGSVELADVPSGVDAAVLLVAPVVMSDLVQRDDTFAPAILGAYLGCADDRGELCTDQQMNDADPTRHMGTAPAPIYAIHGGLDGMFPGPVHGAALAEAWTTARVDAHVEVAPFAGHNLDSSNVDVAAMEAFLDQAVATRSRTSS